MQTGAVAQTYVVGSLSNVAEGRGGEAGDNLLNLDVFGHDGGSGNIGGYGESLVWWW